MIVCLFVMDVVVTVLIRFMVDSKAEGETGELEESEAQGRGKLAPEL